ncbi:MAG TPA: elongation factor G [Fimbriimonadales bacterium]|nr:elongation factor G [Fimbriimonadales bacterium]
MEYKTENIRNVAIVGHGGAGKTTLVEQMLWAAGAIDRLGSVDQGTSHSDFEALEIKRKISLSASILSLEWKGTKINIIDVPGFPDFIGDLYGVARVVEAMIIVTPAQTVLDVGFDNAWELAEEQGIARLIFVNKMERENADYPGLMKTLENRFGKRVVPLQVPVGSQLNFKGVYDLIDNRVHLGDVKNEKKEEPTADIKLEAQKVMEWMMDSAAEGDDSLMEKYLEGQSLSEEEITKGLEAGVSCGKIFPVLLGSASMGIGVIPLLDHIVGLVPNPTEKPKKSNEEAIIPDTTAPLCCFVFKTTADPFVGRINYLRVMQGTLKPDSQIKNATTEEAERIGTLFFPRGKEQLPASAVIAGDIAGITKLQKTKTGDSLCDPKNLKALKSIEFPEPIYRLAIVPKTKADEDKLGNAIQRLADEDPTFRHHRDPESGQYLIEGMGDIHLDVIIEKLREKFGVNVTTEEAKIPYRETIKVPAKAQGKYKKQSGGRGQYGDCWVELTPLPRGSGFEFTDSIVGGVIPKNYLPAIEKGVVEAKQKGVIAGFPVVDFRCNVYHGSYHEVDSSEQAFKMAGAMAFRAAAQQAQPTILEPILSVEIDVPEEFTGDVISDLNTRRGRPMGMELIAPGKQRIYAEVPMATMTKYALDLRSITKGRGRFRTKFARYEEVPANEQQTLIAEYQKRKAQEQED